MGAVKSWISGTSVYNRLKASIIYDLYWMVANRQVLSDRDTEVKFYRALLKELGEDRLIFDIGANHGYKADIFIRLGARVIAVDPDPLNQEILRRRFLALRLSPKPVAIVGKAVGEAVGHATMWVDEPGSAKNTLSDKWVSTLRHDAQRFGESLEFQAKQTVDTTTVSELIKSYGQPDFVKIDVEGYECNVLSGMREPVRLLSFEINLPEFLEEGERCIDIANGLAAGAEFNVTGPRIGDGFLLKEWVEATTMSKYLRECQELSVEIFCRTPVPEASSRPV